MNVSRLLVLYFDVGIGFGIVTGIIGFTGNRNMSSEWVPGFQLKQKFGKKLKLSIYFIGDAEV